jgi:23S rRNA (adenine1618-N6)-methyltransferase
MNYNNLNLMNLELLKKKSKRENFNDKMHPENKYYNNKPNFKLLAKKHPEFSKFVYKNKFNSYSINWKNKDAVKELCKTLLKEDFKIEYWDIPDGYLIPTITSRLNYLYWIKDLLQDSKRFDGIDIGTGANLIYPLLGNKIFKSKFVATDINEDSLKIAKEIITRNCLDNEIKLVLQKNEENIFEGVISENDQFGFSMCNPPYFVIEEDVKQENPNTDCQYNEKEVYCRGGEYRFINNMIRESKVYKYNIIWFTTLVGKKKNYDLLLKLIKSDREIEDVRCTTFYQGKLARWGLAWTYLKKKINIPIPIRQSKRKEINIFQGEI